MMSLSPCPYPYSFLQHLFCQFLSFSIYSFSLSFHLLFFLPSFPSCVQTTAFYWKESYHQNYQDSRTSVYFSQSNSGLYCQLLHIFSRLLMIVWRCSATWLLYIVFCSFSLAHELLNCLVFTEKQLFFSHWKIVQLKRDRKYNK